MLLAGYLIVKLYININYYGIQLLLDKRVLNELIVKSLSCLLDCFVK